MCKVFMRVKFSPDSTYRNYQNRLIFDSDAQNIIKYNKKVDVFWNTVVAYVISAPCVIAAFHRGMFLGRVNSSCECCVVMLPSIL